jgi:cupin superfamily protein
VKGSSSQSAAAHHISAVRAPFNLARLIAPINVGTFWDSHWEQRPLMVRRNDPEHYRDLLSLANADVILSSLSINPLDVRVVRDGRDLSVAALKKGSRNALGLEATYADFRAGATIVVQFLELRHQPVRTLCQSLTQDFSAGVHVNMYVTPPNAHALQTHFDAHDVFVLQVHGAKHWRIYDPPIRLPLEAQAEPRRSGNQRCGPDGQAAHGRRKPMHELTLHQGDMVYIPRGFLHDATSTDSLSVHLTVGITPVTWLAAIISAVEMIGETDPRFREALPPGFARSKVISREAETHLRELIEVAVERLPAKDAIRFASQRVASSSPPSLEGHLMDLEAEPRINLHTIVSRRPDINPTLSCEGSAVRLTFHGKALRMAIHAEPALQFIVSADKFTPAGLPGELSDSARLVLVRRLVREGLLTTS